MLLLAFLLAVICAVIYIRIMIRDVDRRENHKGYKNYHNKEGHHGNTDE